MVDPRRLRALDLFAGGGGVAVAMRALGLDATHVELDPDACATLRAAGERDVRCMDVRRLASYLRPGQYDIVWSSHPCPKWSTATSRTRENAVDGWPWALDVIDAALPPRVCVENVRGAPGEVWEADLLRRGYKVTRGVLDAQWFGVPQTRRRLLLLAWRGSHAPPWPRETVSTPHTLGSALEPVAGRMVCAGGRAGTEPWRLARPSPTVMTTEVKGTRASRASGWTFNGGPDRASDATFLATGLRRVSESEAARLQGFPEGWPFQGTSLARYRQIGNAVPPPLAEAALRSVLHAS